MKKILLLVLISFIVVSCKENPLSQYEGDYTGQVLVHNINSQDSIWTDTFQCKIAVTINYANKNQLSFKQYDNNNSLLNQWNAVEVNNVGEISHFGDCCNTFYGTISKDSLKITNSILLICGTPTPFCNSNVYNVKTFMSR